jgi:hypothetical protein
VSAELISPELALVCPDVRARAIAVLPSPQPWFPKPPDANAEPLRHVPPRTAERAGRRAEVSRVVASYLLARATDLLAVMAGIAIFVLVLAALAGLARG